MSVIKHLKETTTTLFNSSPRDRTMQLFVSKIDPDYAYGQMNLSEEISR